MADISPERIAGIRKEYCCFAGTPEQMEGAPCPGYGYPDGICEACLNYDPTAPPDETEDFDCDDLAELWDTIDPMGEDLEPRIGLLLPDQKEGE